MSVDGVKVCRNVVTDDRKEIGQNLRLASRHPLPRCNDQVCLSSSQWYRLLQLVQACSGFGLCSIITCVSIRVAHAATPPLGGRTAGCI
jgi:hypothetical protein